MSREIKKYIFPYFLIFSSSSTMVYEANEKVLPKTVLPIVNAAPKGQKTCSVFNFFLYEK